MVRFIPAKVWASWPWPNYVDPVRHPATIALYAINGVFLGIATLAVVARLYTRVILRNWFGLDDLFLVLAFIPAIGVAACVILGLARYDWNIHVWDVPLTAVTPAYKLLFATKLLWSLTSCTIRISILFFYYRVLDHCDVRRYRWVLHFVMAFVVTVMVVYITLCIFTCVPIHLYWAFPAVPHEKCLNEGVSLLVAAIFNTFSEFLVALLPIPVVMRLQMDRKQRWAIASLLSLGFIVSIAGAVRTYYVWLSEIHTFDLSWYSVPHWICAAVEIDLALICACAPALRPLFTRVFMGLGAKVPTVPFRARPDTQAKTFTTAGTKQWKSNASEKYRVIYASHASTVMCQTIDFDEEGFEDDDHGYGHTVSVTASGQRRTRRKGNRNLKKRAKSEEEQRPPVVTAVKEEEVLPFEIVATRSLDIRESWHSSILKGQTDFYAPYTGYRYAPKDSDTDIEKSYLQVNEYDLGERKMSEGSQTQTSGRRPSSTTTKAGSSTRVQSQDEEDYQELVDSPKTVKNRTPTVPPNALVRENSREVTEDDRGVVLDRRKASQGSWWEFDFGPTTNAAQEDRTMWSHAFDRVFSGDGDTRPSSRL